jgi:hypothetical protein
LRELFFPATGGKKRRKGEKEIGAAAASEIRNDTTAV